MPKEFVGIQVKPRPNEPIDRMIHRFTKAVRNSSILTEFVEKSRYEKPSVKRRKKHNLALWKLSQDRHEE